MIADRPRRHLHRQHAESLADASLNRRPLRPQRGKGAGPAAQHRDEEARRHLTQALDMANHFVDPHRRFVAEGRRDRVLPMGATGDWHLGATLGQISHRRERSGDQAKEDPVGLAQHHKIAGLRDVLRRRPPMHPPTVWFANNPAEFPDQRDDSVASAREHLVYACRLDVEPCLPSVFQLIERTNAGIGYARGSRQFIAHDGSSVRLRNFLESHPNRWGRYTARCPMASDSWTLRRWSLMWFSGSA